MGINFRDALAFGVEELIYSEISKRKFLRREIVNAENFIVGAELFYSDNKKW